MKIKKLKYVAIILISVSLFFIITSIWKIIHGKYQIQNSIKEFENYKISDCNKKNLKDSNEIDNEKIKSDYIGILLYQKNNIKIPILKDTTKESLEKGAGHLVSSSMPPNKGECFLFGHRDTVFSCLKNVKISDIFILKTYKGEFKYKVAYTKITKIDKKEILMEYGQNTLVMVTCYPFGYIGSAPKRFIVVCCRD